MHFEKGFALGGFTLFLIFLLFQISSFSIGISDQIPVESQKNYERNQWIKEKIRTMTMDELIGQMIMWHIDETVLSSQSAQLLNDYPFGGVIIMGNHTKEQLKTLNDAINAIASPIPRFIAIDQEGGVVKRLLDDKNPGPRVLSQISQKERCDVYKETTRLLKETKVNMNFGIIGDIGWFPHGFISPRTFANIPEKVTDYMRDAVQCSTEVLTTVKHFPGHGRTALDSHKTVPAIQTPYREWKLSDALPFQKAIDMGIPVIMLGHLRYETIASDPATLSPYWSSILRSMGHKGIIITDDLGMLEQNGKHAEEITEKAVLAGSDILLFVTSTISPNSVFTVIRKNIASHALTKEQLTRHVQTILQWKYELQKTKITSEM